MEKPTPARLVWAQNKHETLSKLIEISMAMYLTSNLKSSHAFH